jgi:tRNA1Val (adenine37-N6)-methyltransferase
MANKYFEFKQFKIIQEQSAMKVGTDGVLLGAWANCSNKTNILDIGAGTGLIALMLAQRNSTANIDTVEIDKKSYNEALFNIKNTNWKNRVSAFHTSFQDYIKTTNKKYDLIVSNPPFFSNSTKADSTERSTARHNDSLSVAELFDGVGKILTDDGKFCVIIPADSHDKFLSEGMKNGLYCHNKIWVKPTPNISPKRILIEFNREKNKCKKNTIVIESNGRHQYSQEYIDLTKEFYLSF